MFEIMTFVFLYSVFCVVSTMFRYGVLNVKFKAFCRLLSFVSPIIIVPAFLVFLLFMAISCLLWLIGGADLTSKFTNKMDVIYGSFVSFMNEVQK